MLLPLKLCIVLILSPIVQTKVHTTIPVVRLPLFFPNPHFQNEKSAIIIVWGVILCIRAFYCSTYVILYESTNETPTLIYKSFEGTISSIVMVVTPIHTCCYCHGQNRPDRNRTIYLLLKIIYIYGRFRKYYCRAYRRGAHKK